MKSVTPVLSLFAITLLIASFAGCDDSNPVSAFQPEIVNNADAFQFQITHASDVTTTLSYRWSNSGTRATIDHSTATLRGAAYVTLFDANGVQVYSSRLLSSRLDQSAVGAAGNWTVRIAFSDFDGTANFRVEKL